MSSVKSKMNGKFFVFFFKQTFFIWLQKLQGQGYYLGR